MDSPRELVSELQRLIAVCGGSTSQLKIASEAIVEGKPSRVWLASALRDLADRVSLTIPRPYHLPPEVRGKDPLIPEGTDLAIWAWEEAGKLYGIAFQGKSNKPLWHYRFKDEGQRERKIEETIRSRRLSLEGKQRRQQERKEFQHSLKKGDILSSSWGYDQTNIDFYEVTDVKGKQVVLREISSKVVGDSGNYEKVVPVPGKYVGPPIRKTPREGNSVSISSFQSASPWDGKPESRTGPYGGH